MRRRKFLQTSAGLGALAGMGIPGLTVDGWGGDAAADDALPSADEPAGKIGRPVRVVSLAYKGHERPLENVVQLVDSEGARGADIIVLAETYRGLNATSEETLDGPAVTAIYRLPHRPERRDPSPQLLRAD